MTKLTRGESNHNPGNIDRNATKWQGMATHQTDPRFCVFTEPVWGIRALAKVLLSYQIKHELHTVHQLINRWAPDCENNSVAYVEDVARRINRGADVPIHLQDAAQLDAICRAIIIHENGRCIYSDAVIKDAVAKALV